ncbi:hypothetical protein KCU98_g704, partial [Aureobasidium melanogenum]
MLFTNLCASPRSASLADTLIALTDQLTHPQRLRNCCTNSSETLNRSEMAMTAIVNSDTSIESLADRRFAMEVDDNDHQTLNMEELVACALVTSRASVLSQAQILECILENCPRYKSLYALTDDSHVEYTGASEAVLETLNNYIHSFDIPFEIRELADGDMEVSATPRVLYSVLKDVIDDGLCEDKPLHDLTAVACFPFSRLLMELKYMVLRHALGCPGYRLSFESYIRHAAIFAYPIPSHASG